MEERQKDKKVDTKIHQIQEGIRITHVFEIINLIKSKNVKLQKFSGFSSTFSPSMPKLKTQRQGACVEIT